MDFGSMKRKQLQALCKKHGLPANGTNAKMVEGLSALLNGVGETQDEDPSCSESSEGVKAENSKKSMKKVTFFLEGNQVHELLDLGSDVGEAEPPRKLRGRRSATSQRKRPEDATVNVKPHTRTRKQSFGGGLVALAPVIRSPIVQKKMHDLGASRLGGKENEMLPPPCISDVAVCRPATRALRGREINVVENVESEKSRKLEYKTDRKRKSLAIEMNGNENVREFVGAVNNSLRTRLQMRRNQIGGGEIHEKNEEGLKTEALRRSKRNVIKAEVVADDRFQKKDSTKIGRLEHWEKVSDQEHWGCGSKITEETEASLQVEEGLRRSNRNSLKSGIAMTNIWNREDGMKSGSLKDRKKVLEQEPRASKESNSENSKGSLHVEEPSVQLTCEPLRQSKRNASKSDISGPVTRINHTNEPGRKKKSQKRFKDHDAEHSTLCETMMGETDMTGKHSPPRRSSRSTLSWKNVRKNEQFKESVDVAANGKTQGLKMKRAKGEKDGHDEIESSEVQSEEKHVDERREDMISAHEEVGSLSEVDVISIEVAAVEDVFEHFIHDEVTKRASCEAKETYFDIQHNNNNERTVEQFQLLEKINEKFATGNFGSTDISPITLKYTENCNICTAPTLCNETQNTADVCHENVGKNEQLKELMDLALDGKSRGVRLERPVEGRDGHEEIGPLDSQSQEKDVDVQSEGLANKEVACMSAGHKLSIEVVSLEDDSENLKDETEVAHVQSPEEEEIYLDIQHSGNNERTVEQFQLLKGTNEKLGTGNFRSTEINLTSLEYEEDWHIHTATRVSNQVQNTADTDSLLKDQSITLESAQIDLSGCRRKEEEESKDVRCISLLSPLDVRKEENPTVRSCLSGAEVNVFKLEEDFTGNDICYFQSHHLSVSTDKVEDAGINVSEGISINPAMVRERSSGELQLDCESKFMWLEGNDEKQVTRTAGEIVDLETERQVKVLVNIRETESAGLEIEGDDLLIANYKKTQPNTGRTQIGEWETAEEPEECLDCIVAFEAPQTDYRDQVANETNCDRQMTYKENDLAERIGFDVDCDVDCEDVIALNNLCSDLEDGSFLSFKQNITSCNLPQDHASEVSELSPSQPLVQALHRDLVSMEEKEAKCEKIRKELGIIGKVRIASQDVPPRIFGDQVSTEAVNAGSIVSQPKENTLTIICNQEEPLKVEIMSPVCDGSRVDKETFRNEMTVNERDVENDLRESQDDEDQSQGEFSLDEKLTERISTSEEERNEPFGGLNDYQNAELSVLSFIDAVPSQNSASVATHWVSTEEKEANYENVGEEIGAIGKVEIVSQDIVSIDSLIPGDNNSIEALAAGSIISQPKENTLTIICNKEDFLKLEILSPVSDDPEVNTGNFKTEVAVGKCDIRENQDGEDQSQGEFLMGKFINTSEEDCNVASGGLKDHQNAELIVQSTIDAVSDETSASVSTHFVSMKEKEVDCEKVGEEIGAIDKVEIVSQDIVPVDSLIPGDIISTETLTVDSVVSQLKENTFAIICKNEEPWKVEIMSPVSDGPEVDKGNFTSEVTVDDCDLKNEVKENKDDEHQSQVELHLYGRLTDGTNISKEESSEISGGSKCRSNAQFIVPSTMHAVPYQKSASMAPDLVSLEGKDANCEKIREEIGVIGKIKTVSQDIVTVNSMILGDKISTEGLSACSIVSHSKENTIVIVCNQEEPLKVDIMSPICDGPEVDTGIFRSGVAIVECRLKDELKEDKDDGRHSQRKFHLDEKPTEGRNTLEEDCNEISRGSIDHQNTESMVPSTFHGVLRPRSRSEDMQNMNVFFSNDSDKKKTVLEEESFNENNSGKSADTFQERNFIFEDSEREFDCEDECNKLSTQKNLSACGTLNITFSSTEQIHYGSGLASEEIYASISEEISSNKDRTGQNMANNEEILGHGAEDLNHTVEEMTDGFTVIDSLTVNKKLMSGILEEKIVGNKKMVAIASLKSEVVCNVNLEDKKMETMSPFSASEELDSNNHMELVEEIYGAIKAHAGEDAAFSESMTQKDYLTEANDAENEKAVNSTVHDEVMFLKHGNQSILNERGRVSISTDDLQNKFSADKMNAKSHEGKCLSADKKETANLETYVLFDDLSGAEYVGSEIPANEMAREKSNAQSYDEKLNSPKKENALQVEHEEDFNGPLLGCNASTSEGSIHMSPKEMAFSDQPLEKLYEEVVFLCNADDEVPCEKNDNAFGNFGQNFELVTQSLTMENAHPSRLEEERIQETDTCTSSFEGENYFELIPFNPDIEDEEHKEIQGNQVVERRAFIDDLVREKRFISKQIIELECEKANRISSSQIVYEGIFKEESFMAERKEVQRAEAIEDRHEEKVHDTLESEAAIKIDEGNEIEIIARHADNEEADDIWNSFSQLFTVEQAGDCEIAMESSEFCSLEAQLEDVNDLLKEMSVSSVKKAEEATSKVRNKSFNPIKKLKRWLSASEMKENRQRKSMSNNCPMDKSTTPASERRALKDIGNQ